MSNFNKLNGFDVKDSQARSDISSLDNRVTALENGTITDIAVVEGLINSSGQIGILNYPEGYTKDNCCPVAVGVDFLHNTSATTKTYDYGYSGNGGAILWAELDSFNVNVHVTYIDSPVIASEKFCRVVLIKLPETPTPEV